MKKYTELELKDILEKHFLWLAEDPNGVEADLMGADLSKVALNEADLRGVDFRGTNLRGANLCGVYPREAEILIKTIV